MARKPKPGKGAKPPAAAPQSAAGLASGLAGAFGGVFPPQTGVSGTATQVTGQPAPLDMAAYQAKTAEDWTPTDPNSLLPQATFPGQGQDSLQGITDQLNALQQKQFGAREGQVKQDLATQIADLRRQQSQLQTQRGWGQQQADISRQRAGEQGARTQKDIAAQAAGRGGYFSAGREGQQQVAGQQTAQQIEDIGRSLQEQQQREQWQSESIDRQIAQDQQASERQLADLQARQKEAALKGEYQSETTRQNKQRTEATTWARARVNQLRGAGLDEGAARARAIDEAKTHYAGVDPTYLDGAFAPLPTQTSTPALRKLYGVDISQSRARAVTSQKAAEIRGRPEYKQFAGMVDQYMSQAGSGANLQGMVRMYTDHLAQQTNPQTGYPPNAAQIRDSVRRYAHYLSLLAEDYGLT